VAVASHRLTLQAGAYQNSTWVVAVAKGGVEDGNPLIAGSVIVNPDGEIAAVAKTEDDELIVADCDLDATIFGKETIFDFKRHRRVPTTVRTAAHGKRRTGLGSVSLDAASERP
jgi:predicted amidohydrolase